MNLGMLIAIVLVIVLQSIDVELRRYL